MNEFTQVYNQLISSGNVICPVSSPMAFSYLSDESKFNEMQSYLSRTGKFIVRMHDGMYFFLSEILVSDNSDYAKDQKKRCRDQLSTHLNELSTYIGIIQLITEAHGRDSALTSGNKISKPEFVNLATNNAPINARLNNIKKLSKKITITEQVTDLFNLLTDKGYLIKVDEKNEIFQFTGKIDYFYDLSNFISDHLKLAVEDEGDSSGQGDLFS